MQTAIDVERALLSCLLRHPDQAKNLHVEPDMLKLPSHQALLRGIQSLSARGIAADVVAVAHEVSDLDSNEIIDLSKAYEGSDCTGYVSLIMADWRRRSLKRYAETLHHLSEDEDNAAEVALDMMARWQRELQSETTHGALRPISELIDARMQERQNSQSGDGISPILMTGLSDLDWMLSGMRPGQLIMIAGRAKMGKSACAMQIATDVAAKQGRRVAVFSLEMSSAELVDRLLCSEALVSGMEYRGGHGLLSPDAWERIDLVIKSMLKAPMYIDDTRNLSPSGMRNRIDRMTTEHGAPDLIVVDYIQIVNSDTRSSGNRATELSQIAEDLKTMAREVGCPVIAVAQVNRGPESRPDKRPTIADLKESGGLEQAADAVLLLYREAYYTQKEAGEGQGSEDAEIIVAAQRSGPTGTVRVTFDGPFMRFSDDITSGEVGE